MLRCVAALAFSLVRACLPGAISVLLLVVSFCLGLPTELCGTLWVSRCFRIFCILGKAADEFELWLTYLLLLLPFVCCEKAQPQVFKSTPPIFVWEYVGVQARSTPKRACSLCLSADISLKHGRAYPHLRLLVAALCSWPPPNSLKVAHSVLRDPESLVRSLLVATT